MADSRLEDITELVLVSTDAAPADSAATHLREDSRDPAAAEACLMTVAIEAGSQDTADARKRFAKLGQIGRLALLARVKVRDGQAGVGEFRTELAGALGELALPQVGREDFLDRLVGWWERQAVDLLLRRRQTVGKDELAEEVRRLRDQYGAHTLPVPQTDGTATELTDLLLEAYKDARFVHQLALIAVRDERIQFVISNYHRAYAQRSRWLEQGLLAPGELDEWESRLVDEWTLAWHRMLDSLPSERDDGRLENAGKDLYNALEASSLNPLRDRSERFLRSGTLNGLSDVERIGWHPEFKERLLALIGPHVDGQATHETYDTVTETS